MVELRLDLSVTLESSSKLCRQAFPPGRHFTVPLEPDVEEINARGDFAIEMDRLAFIDGDRDPWRPTVSNRSDRRRPRSSPPADTRERHRAKADVDGK